MILSAADSHNVCPWHPVDQGVEMTFALSCVSVAKCYLSRVEQAYHAAQTGDSDVDPFVLHNQQLDCVQRKIELERCQTQTRNEKH